MPEIRISLTSPSLALRGGWEAGTMNKHTYTMDTTKPLSSHLSSSSRKRVRSDVSNSDNEHSDSCNEEQSNEITKSDNWPRFIVLESSDSSKPLTKLSPFAVAKAIQGKYGTVKEVKKMKSGALLIEVTRASQAKSVLETGNFLGIEVTASPHRFLNSSKGVIRDHQKDLFDMSEADILKEISGQGVEKVSRFILKKNGTEIKTNTLFLTFSTPQPPQKLKLGYYIVNVMPYVPNPLRCFQCQEFGHSRRFCRKDLVCWKCGCSGHDGSECTSETSSCVNCKGDHCSSSKSCPVWIQEKEIQRIKVEKSLSYGDARKIVTTSASSATTSYASIVKGPSKTTSVECQTPASWIKDLPPLREARNLLSSDTRSTASGTDETSTLDSRKKQPASPIKSKPAIKKYDKNIEELTKQIEEEIGQKYPVYPDEDPPAHFESEDDMEVTPVFRPQRQRSRTRGRKNISPVTCKK